MSMMAIRWFVLSVAAWSPVAAWQSCEKNGHATNPCVDRISPATGSLAGGQLIFIYGTNLQPEAPDPLVPAAAITIGGTPCDVQRVLSSGTRLVCKTRAYSGFPVDELNGVVAGSPRWHDRGCDSGDQAVDVKVLGVGGNIMGKWNAGTRFCARANAKLGAGGGRSTDLRFGVCRGAMRARKRRFCICFVAAPCSSFKR